ncbi:MAG: metallophosphoesterase family protein [Candidatus Marsarchaeota archaeon]|nr:metallophosphoesterase family protein [Candidatus Marsarchaeota archaeon]
MKIAVMSDFHLGYNEDSFTQAREALEKASAFDLIIICGDLFDSRNPNQETIYEAVKMLAETKKKLKPLKITQGDAEFQNVPIVIPGTHERKSKGMPNIIQILHESGLLVNTHAVKTRVENLSIQGMAGVPDDLSTQALNAMNFEPEKNLFNIFLLHQTIKNIEEPSSDFQDGISTSDLPKNFDLYCNGHIHHHFIFKNILIPGSTVVTQMKKVETNSKGFYVYDTESKKAEFQEIKTRKLYVSEISLENTSVKEIKEKIEDEIAKTPASIPLPMLRIIVNATLKEKEDLDFKIKTSKVLLTVEKNITSSTLKDKINQLRSMDYKNNRQKSIEMVGKKFDKGDELFEALEKGEMEKAAALL